MKTRILLFCLTLLMACMREPNCPKHYELSAPKGFNIHKLYAFDNEGSLKKLQFFNTDMGYILASRGTENPGAVIFKTTDGGNSWDTLTVPTNNRSPLDMQFLDENIGIMTYYPDFSHPVVKRTEDGGQTWTEFTFPELGEGRITNLHADTGQNLYGNLSSVYTPNRIVKSTAKGETWQIIHTLPFGSGNILGLHQNRLYLELQGKEVRVIDLNGNHIKNVQFQHKRGEVSDFEIIDADNIIVANHQNAIQTTDGGDTWRELFTDVWRRCPARVVGFNSTQDGIMIYERGYCGDAVYPNAVIGHTTDGGDSWEESEDFVMEVEIEVIATQKIDANHYVILFRQYWSLYELWLLER